MSQLLPRFAFSVCLCLIAFTANWAQSRWSLTGMSSDTSLWYLDQASIKKKSGIVSAWEKVVYPNDSFSIGINEWNCRTKKKRLLQADDYNASGAVIGHQGTPLPWRFVIPDSIEEITFNIVCGNSDSKEETDVRDGEMESNSDSSFASITKKSALMINPSQNSKTIRRVAIGEKFVLAGEKPTGVWYRVLDPQTDSEGWLNGNHFKIIRVAKIPKKRSPTGRNLRNRRNRQNR